MGYELGIIGAGNMAEAIARGVLTGGLYRADQLIAADVSPERRRLFADQLCIAAVQSSAEAAGQSKILLLSVKPQQMADVLAEIAPAVDPDTRFISIAAGISTGFIERGLTPLASPRVVRVMPNTPMLVGEGMAALCAGRFADHDDLATARRIFESAAAVIEVSEDQMDAVTAVSGSGPAYVFYLVEQMIRAGMELGLSGEQAHALATKTALGAARMLRESTDPPAELRQKVTSPGGTTQAAIESMQVNKFDQIVVKAIRRAHQRSGELGK